MGLGLSIFRSIVDAHAAAFGRGPSPGGGALLAIGVFVPLGLTLLGPVIVNILCFHIFLEPKGLPIAVVVSALALFLLWAYRWAFRGLIQSRPPAA